jgi:hypothetical protein
MSKRNRSTSIGVKNSHSPDVEYVGRGVGKAHGPGRECVKQSLKSGAFYISSCDDAGLGNYYARFAIVVAVTNRAGLNSEIESLSCRRE